MASTAGERAAAELAAHGLCATRQRVEILRILRRRSAHPTATEIHRAVLEAAPRVSLKTVYQVQDSLVSAGLASCVTEGDRLFHSDELGTNGVACAMCHPHGSNTHPETYPKFQAQLMKKVALQRDMVKWCILNPLEGPELAHDDPRMKALEAYMLAQRAGKAVEVGKH